MKLLSVLLLLIFGSRDSFSQFIKAPDVNFGGSKLDWIYTVKDTTEPDMIFSTPTFSNKEVGSIVTRPFEHNNKVIFSVNNNNYSFMGTIVTAYDNYSGDTEWSKIYNPYFEMDYGYSYFMEMKTNQNDHLLLRGVRGVAPLGGITWSGHYAQRMVDINTGNTLNEYKNTKQSIRSILSNPAEESNNSYFFVYNVGFVNNQPYDIKIYPIKIDIKNDTVSGGLNIDDGKFLTFNSRDDNGNSNNFRMDGPFTTDNKTFTYLLQYEQNKKAVQWLWKTDKDANVLDKKEISSIFGELYFEAEQKDSLIELITVTKDGVYQGHRGYMFIDMDGNVVRRNSKLTIDGKKAGHLSTTRLKGTDEVLHVIRFQDSNDIFLYRETKDKTYIKAGQLENKNSNAYAFIPKFLLQTSDFGLVLTGSFLMDTAYTSRDICKFDCGGWPVIMKLSAATLGLPTSTQDGSYADAIFTLSPNPSTDRVTITIPEIHHAHNIYITDQTGRRVLQNLVSGIINEIDISALQAGMYYVSLADDSGRSIGRVEKLVKM